MSAAATIAVWRFREAELTATDRYVLLALADEADSQGFVDGRSRRGANDLAGKTHLSRKTIDRTLHGLIKAGLVSVIEAPSRGGKNGGSPGDYLLTFIDRTDTVTNRSDERMDMVSGSKGHGDQSVDDRAPLAVDNPGSSPGTSDVSDAERLANLLADLIETNGSKRPSVAKSWIVEIDRMIRIDGRPVDLIEKAIRWCQADPFWRANVMSPTKLRKQYDRLRLQSIEAKRRDRSGRTGEPSAMGGMLDLVREEMHA